MKRLQHAGWWVLVLATSVLQPQPFASSSRPAGTSVRLVNDTEASGRHGAVVSAEAHATKIGLQVLRDGGNAVDAAVAVALALAVSHPGAGNLGGGGFMIIRMADGRTQALDFREVAPGKAHRDMYLREDGSVHPEKSLWGALAVGVPGSPAGLLAAHEKFGSVPFARLVAPAIRLAKLGIDVNHLLADSLASKVQILGRFATTRAVFFRDGKPFDTLKTKILP